MTNHLTEAISFTVPARADVSANNQAIFDNLHKMIGFVPNLYAYFAHSETALADYIAFQNRKSTLNAKEREIINLVTSQVNGCRYCQSAHTAVGKMVGLSEEEILEIRTGNAAFDAKYHALATFIKSVDTNRGKVTEDEKAAFFAAGYTQANLVDAMIVVGDKSISNYLHNISGIEIDWPLAEEIA